jgi:hypothetical protein
MSLSGARNLLIACAIAASIWPIFGLMDALRGACADGLCGFWESLLFGGGLTVAALVFMVRGLRRREQPEWLALAAIVLLLLPAYLLAF